MIRRTFLASLSGSALALSPVQSNFEHRETADEVILGNGVLRLTFDRASGALVRLENRPARKLLAIAPSAAAPVRLWLGSRTQPDEAVLTLARSVSRKCDWQTVELDGDLSIVVRYEDLTHAGRGTGIALTQTYTISPKSDFVRLQTTIENQGAWWITGVFLGLESLSLNAEAARERLVTGGVSSAPIMDPRHAIPAGSAYVKYPARRRSFSVPPTVPTSLMLTWMDYSDDQWGLGTCYLDRSDMDLVGDVRAETDGLALGWRLFRLEGTRAFMSGINGTKQIYPLAPGEQFISDEWMLVLHAGDWHKTASAYRKRYEVVFRNDFLDWEHTSPAVRAADIVLNHQIAWGNPSSDKSRAYAYPNGHVIHRFDEIAPLTRKAIDALDVRPQNVIVNTLGTATDWGIYKMPDYFPMVEQAGGQAAAEQMARDLEAIGVAGICCYAHPYFMHRHAHNYLPAADTGWNYPHQDWHTSMGGIACIAESSWYQLWVEKIFPRYAAMGIRGLYFDEGFGHQFICTHPEHSHGGSSISILTAQSRGATRLYRAFHSVVGPKSFLCCESGSDVQARFIDLWHFNPTEVLRFTHPDKLMKATVNPKRITESIADALLFGCPLIVMPFPDGRPDILHGEMLDSLRRFVALRRQLREAKAPGYPQGFCDTTGLSVPDGQLRAKVFKGQSGATVVYFAREAFEGEVVLETAQLGMRGLGRVRRRIKIAAKQMGYEVIS
jgi:hypothetical protein